MKTKAATVTGVFSSLQETESVLNRLKEEGIRHSDVSCLIPERILPLDEILPKDQVSKAAAEAAYSGLKWTDRVGEVYLPGMGHFIGSGPIKAATLHTAKSDEGIVGTLTHMGVEVKHAEKCKRALAEGKILLTVHVHDDDMKRKAERIFLALKVA